MSGGDPEEFVRDIEPDPEAGTGTSTADKVEGAAACEGPAA